MSRFLFVTLPLTGHAHPIAAVAAALGARGHEAVWAGSESFLRPILGPDALVHPIPLRAHRGQAEQGMAAAKTRWEGYIAPHAKATLPGIEQAIATLRPDVLAVDQHAIAGALAAHRHALPWASLAPTTMELSRPYRATLPKVEDWITALMAAMWTRAGLPGEPPHDLRFSPHLLIAFTGAALAGEVDGPTRTALVGPALAARPPDPGFPFDALDPARRLVLVSMGTLSMDIARDFHARAIEALRPLGERVQAIVVAPDGTIPDPPAHVLVRSRVPVLELMPRLDAVIGHGGLNTVCEALVHGVPLVIAPIKGDQPVNAEQVAAAGAGIRVSFPRVRPDALRGALTAVLEDPSYRTAADRLGRTLRAAGGAEAAAALLEDLAGRAARPADPVKVGLCETPA